MPPVKRKRTHGGPAPAADLGGPPEKRPRRGAPQPAQSTAGKGGGDGERPRGTGKGQSSAPKGGKGEEPSAPKGGKGEEGKGRPKGHGGGKGGEKGGGKGKGKGKGTEGGAEPPAAPAAAPAAPAPPPSSRIRVVGFHDRTTSERLRGHFAGCGEITDCAIIRSKQTGRPRMAFVGFKTAAQAAEAVRRLNRSFLDSGRLSVEVAKPAGASDINANVWSKHTKKRLEKERKVEEEKRKAREAEEKAQREAEEQERQKRKQKQKEMEDQGMADFLKVAKGARSQRMVWENDLDVTGGAGAAGPAADSDGESSAGGDAASLDSAAEAERQQRLSAMDDMAFLRSKQQAKRPPPDPAGTAAEGDAGSPSKRPRLEQQQQQQQPKGPPAAGAPAAGGDPEADPEEQVLESGRIYIRNLPFSANEDEVRELCEAYGPVAEAHVPLTRDTAQSKGVAFVQFAIPDHALAAMRALHASIFQGRLLGVEPGRPNPYERDEATEAARKEKSSYKKQRAAKEKADAANPTRWNTLFMGADAVASALAKRLDLGKDALVGKDSKDVAARMAIGEAHLTSEVRELFGEEGLDLAVLSSESRTQKRSDRVILVKNLPKDSSVTDLTRLFEGFGAVDRVVAPKDMTIALIEYVTAQEAKVAFRKLAFRPFNHVPLFLEWAPVGALRGDRDAKAPEPPKAKEPAAPPAAAEDIFSEEQCTLYLTNVPFSVGQEDLRRYVTGAAGADKGEVKSVKLATTGGRSRGFAFVQLLSNAAARRVKAALERTPLVQRQVAAAFAQAPSKDAQSKRPEACPPGHDPLKLTVKNVPFEATKQDIRKIFAGATNVKSVRLPRKSTGAEAGGGAKRPHRGFAFVEFGTPQEAQQALAALSNTHLYGRHLVIQYAKAGDAAGHIADD